MSVIPSLSPTDIANLRAMQHEVTVAMAQAEMVDTCQRLKYVESRDEDNQETGLDYQPDAVYACRFQWGTGSNADRTDESVDNLVASTPRMRVPADAVFTSRDQVLLTHRYGQVLDVPLTFAIDGEPQLEAGYIFLKLERVTT